MAVHNYTPGTLSLSKTRYTKPFEVLRGYLDNGFPTLSTGDGFLEGTVVDIDASGKAVVAASGTAGIGFALQTVKDMSGMNGYRNLQNTNANLGEMIGVQMFQGVAATAVHEGSGDPGDWCWWDGSTLQFDATLPSGVTAIGKLLYGDGKNVTTGVNSTAGSKSVASGQKAIVAFDFGFGGLVGTGA